MSGSETTAGTSAEDSYVYDEATGEWVAAGAGADKDAGEDGVVVRDSVGNVLADGDQVTLIKSIRLTGDAQEIDCRYEGIKGLVLRAEFVRKR